MNLEIRPPNHATANQQSQRRIRPVLLDAIDATLRALEARAKLYRNLVLAASAVSMLSILLAVLLHRWIAFAGLVLLVPLTGGYLIIDSRLLRRWRTAIGKMARLRSLDVIAFQQTISRFRHLPPKVLKAMLSTIPARHEEGSEETSRPEEIIVGAAFDAVGRESEAKIFRATCILTIALVCLITGAYYGSVELLLSAGSLIILVAVFARP